MLSNVAYVLDDTKGETRRKILDWLAPYFATRHEELKKVRAEDSGKWFLQSNEFTYWTYGNGPWAEGGVTLCLICAGIRKIAFVT